MSKNPNVAKMTAIMEEIKLKVVERDELILCIAIALIAKKNIFILGDTGQAKSQVIDEFRKRINDTRQFDKLMSKQADEEQLFGRLDLSSIIPGNVSRELLMQDFQYVTMMTELQSAINDFRANPKDTKVYQELKKSTEELAAYQNALAQILGGQPRMITKGKIPDSEIVFLDELFKANEGILNALLKALNEREWTNEGEVMKLPVISYMSASNEIPNFNNPEENILKPLYDRFDLKVKTEYVEDKNNRLKILRMKRQPQLPVTISICLSELVELQKDVFDITVSPDIDETIDDILCELRNKGIHVSDRKFFNYQPIAQAYALLQSRNTVVRQDLLILKSYFWNTPEEIPVVEDVLKRYCENPVSEKLKIITDDAVECYALFETADNKKKALIKIRNEFLRLYDGICVLKKDAAQGEQDLIQNTLAKIEDLSKTASEAAGNTYIPLPELKELSK